MTMKAEEELKQVFASLNRQVAELKDKLADQQVLRAELVRQGQEIKRLEGELKSAKADELEADND